MVNNEYQHQHPVIYKFVPVPFLVLSRAMGTNRAISNSKSDPKLEPDGYDLHFKRQKFGDIESSSKDIDLFDALPDDLIVSVLSCLSSSANSPSDLISILLTCKRLNVLGSHPVVLSKASKKSLAVRAKNWSASCHRFLERCSDSRNLEASYILGMIRFYCLEMRQSGLSLMARAARGSHALALYSLAVIRFNGTGGGKSAKNLGAGFVLCARAALLGHVDAIRESGHCLIDGYGVAKNVANGRNLLFQANVSELIKLGLGSSERDPNKLLTDFRRGVSDPFRHPVNRFLVEWFGCGSGDSELRTCSYEECGRKESRRHEFRGCAVCGKVNYCSRACQARHWRRAHKDACSVIWAPLEGEN